MAVRDLRSNQIAQFLGSITVGADTTTNFTGIIDNAEYELGVMFSIQVTTLDAASPGITVVVEESDDPTFTTTDTITPTPADDLDKFIGSGGPIDVTAVTPSPTINPTVEARMFTFGVWSNKRYLRPAVVDVGGAGNAVLACFANQAAENLPVVEPDA